MKINKKVKLFVFFFFIVFSFWGIKTVNATNYYPDCGDIDPEYGASPSDCYFFSDHHSLGAFITYSFIRR